MTWSDSEVRPRGPGALVAIRGHAPERVYVGLLATVLALAIVAHGGRDFIEWSVCLALLGL
ncbi:MAG: hypothetical protein DMF90_18925 [Acidobacteria bacterium]|nr:MAG: hypothetical protein DMF90_18925 [Acidobacteriota bacterium]